MKRSVNVFFIMLMLAVVALVPGGAALADTPDAHHGGFTHDNGVPHGSKLILNIMYVVVNDEDSGNAGYWALDDYTRLLQVWKTPDGSFYAIAKYLGVWKTFAGALSPGAGVVQTKDGRGTFEGGYTATFTATSYVSKFGAIGIKDFKGTKEDILKGTYGAGQTGATAPFSWLSAYFTGADNFTYINWGWTYKYRNQAWNNYQSGTTGDIVIK
jgi:hypothetical protein